ncbi:hypothetical protein KR52_02715 [Synechococcus sp. KORDI-52]|uniref:hypothetical protein n=1 Tax=Synechococcus sp. KORDI-52 TaxID=585425 RepID=UPI0004E07EAB|nr:hypothetical protein [Synechococcus sp. KORDI-52]AII48072.1 hypothetical protein KR52_02715 [Synechococcus sp. KORDI-52]
MLEQLSPVQLLNILRQRRIAGFCLGPKGDRQVDAIGYRHTFVDSFRCLTSLLPQMPELRQIVSAGRCASCASGRWLGQDEPGSGGRRIRNTRLKQLGDQLQQPSLDQSGVLAASQVP